MKEKCSTSIVSHAGDQVNPFLSGYMTHKLLRMVELSEWSKWWDAPPEGLQDTIADLKKSGLTPETCQKARLIPLTYFLRQMEERTARRFIKVIARRSSSKADDRDLLMDGELLGFPYFSQEDKLLFVRIRAYPPILKNENGKTTEQKYLQPQGVPALPYIQPEVWEVVQKPHKPIWITEGEKKALSLLQNGRYAVSLSGVWNFKAGEKTARAEEDKNLWQELQDFNWSGRLVYLGFDMDLWVNPQVRLALFELGLKLISRGAVVRVPFWNKNLKGIDDFLSQYPDGLDEIEERAKRLEDVIREEDLDGVVRALSKVELTPERREQLYRNLAKRLGIKSSTLEKAVWRKAKEEAQEQKPVYPQEVLKQAEEVLKGNIVDRLLQDLEKLYAGRQEHKLLLYLTVMSRKVKNLFSNLMVIVKGDASEGKSTLVRSVLNLMNQTIEEECMEISYQSKAYLYYGVDDLSGRVLFLTELEGSTKGLYPLKLALSEKIMAVRSLEANNGIRRINRKIPAESMAAITTGIRPRIEEDLGTRAIILTLTSDEKLRHEALKVMFLVEPEEKEKVRQLWRAVDSLLEPAEVVIPWMKEFIASLEGRMTRRRYNRDVAKFIALVQASALIHQHQRQRDERGRVIAQREDYELAYRLQSLFTETLTGVPDYVVHVVSTLKDLIEQERARREQEKKVAKDLFEEAERIKRENDGFLPAQVQELMQKMKALLSRPEEEKIRIKKSLLVEELARRTGKSERTARTWVEQTAKEEEDGEALWIRMEGSGRNGAYVVLLTDEVPEPQFLFQEPSKIFDKNELPDCPINGKALSDNDLNKAKPVCPILPNLGGEIRQNEAKGSCLIYDVDTQGSDGNKAIGQSNFSQNFSSFWKNPPTFRRFTERPNDGDEKLLNGNLKNLLAPPYRAECELIDHLQVLSVYVCRSEQVFCRIDLSVRDGLDYEVVFSSIEKAIKGELKPAEKEGLPYPVYKVCGKTGQEIVSGPAQRANRATVEEKLTALKEEFKRLKRQHSADHMTYYYNAHSKEWELIKGNETILKLPLVNGLSLEDCLRLLRRRFEDALKPSDDLLDF